MSRINLFLLGAVMLSAFFLVHTQYESRRLYTQLDRAHTQASRLDLEHEQLVVQKRAEATSSRIQHIAVSQLGMRPANPAITYYVTAEVSPGAAQTAPGFPPPPPSVEASVRRGAQP